jgi:hypothetical protein
MVVPTIAGRPNARRPVPLHRVTPEDAGQGVKRHVKLPYIQGLLDLVGLANEVRHQKRRADLEDAAGGRKPDATKGDRLLSRPVGAIKAEALYHLGWEPFRSVGQNLLDRAYPRPPTEPLHWRNACLVELRAP